MTPAGTAEALVFALLEAVLVAVAGLLGLGRNRRLSTDLTELLGATVGIDEHFVLQTSCFMS
jgi:hypothetical protein